MPAWTRSVLKSVAFILAGCCGWALVELLRAAPSHALVNPQTPSEMIVLAPSRGALGYFVFLVCLVMECGITVALGLTTSKKSDGRWRTAPAASLAIGLAIASLIAGYGYEALHTELRLSRTGVTLREGRAGVRIPYGMLRSLELKRRGPMEALDMQTAAATFRVDIGMFAAEDQSLLLRILPGFAGMRRTKKSGTDAAWQRVGPSILPASGEE